MTLIRMRRQKYSSISEETSQSTCTTASLENPEDSHSTHNRNCGRMEAGSSLTVTYRELKIEESFDIVKTLAEGCFAKVLLVNKKSLGKLVLKAIHCELTTRKDFSREMKCNYFLSAHQNILTCFNVSFVWSNCYVYVQEYAPYGDLSRYVKRGGLPEAQVKLIAGQVSSALDFMHSVQLVHRDLKLENILVFKPNLTQVKLCDFGQTRIEGTLVTKTHQTWMPFSPPEICQVVPLEKYYCHSSSDVWQMGIILCVCLTGTSPWQCADITDPRYRQYEDWHRRRSLRMPDKFKVFTPRLVRLFKRLLQPKASKRSLISEVSKYVKDDWMRRGLLAPSLHCGPTNVNNNNSWLCPGSNKYNNNLVPVHNLTNINTPSSGRRESTTSLTADPQPVQPKRSQRGSRGSGKATRFSLQGLDTDVDKNERVVDWIVSSCSSTSASII